MYCVMNSHLPVNSHLYKVSSPFNGDKKENTTYRQISLSFCVCVCMFVCLSEQSHMTT